MYDVKFSESIPAFLRKIRYNFQQNLPRARLTRELPSIGLTWAQ